MHFLTFIHHSTACSNGPKPMLSKIRTLTGRWKYNPPGSETCDFAVMHKKCIHCMFMVFQYVLVFWWTCRTRNCILRNFQFLSLFAIFPEPPRTQGGLCRGLVPTNMSQEIHHITIHMALYSSFQFLYIYLTPLGTISSTGVWILVNLGGPTTQVNTFLIWWVNRSPLTVCRTGLLSCLVSNISVATLILVEYHPWTFVTGFVPTHFW